VPPNPARIPGRSRRITLLGALAVATLLLAAWLGYEAVTASGAYRQAAESVLADYAEVAISTFAARVDDDLDDFLDTAFDEIDGEFRDFGGLPDPREIAWEMDDAAREVGCRQCAMITNPFVAFVADLSSGSVRTSPESFSRSAVLALADTIARHRTDVVATDDEGLLAVLPGVVGPDSVMVGYLLARDAQRGTRVMGFAASRLAVAELFGDWFRDTRLLPEPIGADLPNDSLLSVRVSTPDGAALYASPMAYEGAQVARRDFGVESGNLQAELAVRPERAAEFIIGGFPRSRAPLLIVLLVLTLGVGGAALVQFRRELHFQRLRDDFVSGVSHELRTPLAQIRMFAELQDTGRLTTEEDRRRAASVIHRESRRLSHLVENILQFSRLRYGEGRDVVRERLDLRDVIAEGADAMESVLAARGMTLETEVDGEVVVSAGRDALTRILVNLIDNAAKYGPDGQTVRVRARRAGDRAVLEVEDEGPGVPMQDRDRIWKPYRRLERDVKAQLPGTGIGLSVVAELTGLHEGRARVEAADGGGARFVVDLPALPESASPAAARGIVPTPANVGPA